MSIAIAEQMQSPSLLQQLAAIRRKIIAAFPKAISRISVRFEKRILIGSPASDVVLASFAAPPKPLARVAEAFFNMKRMSISYVDQHGAATSREVEPHFLYFSMPVWYVLAWDRLRGAVRCFRIDRIKSVTARDTSFRLADAALFLAEAEKGIAAL